MTGPESGATTTVTQAYRFEVDPTPEQVDRLSSHTGGARTCYNKLLGLVKDNWDANRARKDAGEQVPREEYLSTRQFGLQALWYQKRDEVAPWWAENASSTYNFAQRNLARAFTNFFEGRSGFPNFKPKGRHESVTLAANAVGVVDTHHVRFSRVGVLKTYESMRKLTRHLERGSGRITSVTATRRAGRFYVSFAVEVQRAIMATRAPSRVIGIDVGLSTLYTGATPEGELVLSVDNPRHYQHSEVKLARAQRLCSRRQGPGPGKRPSNRYRRANHRVQQIHADIANARKNLIHKTTTQLAKNYDVIIVEHLHIKSMMKNRSLAKHIQDAAWGEFTRQLEYKSKWYGATVVRAGRFFPSSKTCSHCGTVKANLSLDERVFNCETCGLAIDREHNAAINLARLSSQPTAAGTRSVAGRGGKVRAKRQKHVAQARPGEASTETPTLVCV